MVEEMAGNTVVGNLYENNVVYVRHPEDVGMIKETSNVNSNTTKVPFRPPLSLSFSLYFYSLLPFLIFILS
jgi:hypothetical protein